MKYRLWPFVLAAVVTVGCAFVIVGLISFPSYFLVSGVGAHDWKKIRAPLWDPPRKEEETDVLIREDWQTMKYCALTFAAGSVTVVGLVIAGIAGGRGRGRGQPFP